MPEWRPERLTELLEFREGPGILAVDFHAKGVPLIRLAGLKRDGNILDGCNYLDPSVVERRWSQFKLQRDDVLLSTSASLGEVAIVGDAGVGAIPYTGLIRFRPKDDRVIPAFIPYMLREKSFKEQIKAMGVGSVMKHFGPTHLRSMAVICPPRPVQRAIIEVLGAVDAKISANQKRLSISLTLVNAEFERRFGSRPLMDTLGSLVQVVDCLHSKKPSAQPEGPSLIQLSNIRDDGLIERTPSYPVSLEDFQKWSQKFLTRPWDFVITNVGRVGAVSRIPAGYSAALGRNMTGIRPHDSAEAGAFIAGTLLSRSFRKEIEQKTDAGSVMNALNVRSIPLLRVPRSSSSERRAFHVFGAPLLESADLLLTENHTLAATRDALLPQLMSGKLRVRDAEAAASAAGA